MAQWEKLRNLSDGFKQKLHDLYVSDAFPMDVRHYLSVWIEKQEWQRAARDHALAMVLFQVLLENLDNQHSRFIQEECFLMQHNIRRYKQNFQEKYQDDPCALASTIQCYLNKEKDILDDEEMNGKIEHLRVEQEPMDTSSQQDLHRKMASLREEMQRMEHTMICLEEQQDEFDFKCQIHKMEAVVDEAMKKEQVKVLQLLVNKLNDCRKSTLSELKKLLDRIQELINLLVNRELADWQRSQQKSCIGASDSICLDQLEKWFTCVAVCLFKVREFLSKLEELVEKVTYANDPVKAKKPALQKRTDQLLKDLLQSSFVVESQPSMPPGKGPLVLKTTVQFSVKTRLLVKFPELNHSMKVEVSMDREVPQIKGYRRFNVLGTKIKALNMAESYTGGMVADFRHLSLKEQKSGGGKVASDISLSVTEELHLIYFNTVFEMKGLSVELQASSLPVVIISNSSQQQSAGASVLWFNMLSQNPKDILFFANTPAAPWPQFGEMLSWQFLSATKRGLDGAQLDMIAQKLFGKQSNYDTCKVSWSKFIKENAPDTFWVWFDGILVLVKTYLEQLWREGLIMGFVSKGKEKSLLKKKQRGTFLLRFSESVIGGITFSWVENTSTGEPDVKTVQPFTKADLSQIPFHEIVRNFQIFEDDNVPENPLIYLYPNIPKDEAFRKHYTEKTGADSPYIKYIKTKLVFVSKENTLEAWSPMSTDMTQGDGLEPNNGLCGEAADQDGLPHPLETSLEMCLPDPMLSGSSPEEELLAFIENPHLFDDTDILPDVTALPEFCFQGLNLLQQPSSGIIFPVEYSVNI